MKAEEVKQMLSVIKSTYRKHYENMNNNDLKRMLDVWCDVFAEDDPILIMTALKCYLRQNTSGFPPVPGQLIDIANDISNPVQIDADEAWAMVYKALSDSFYHANEEFEKLPKEVQAGVGSPAQLRSWCMMECSTLNSVTASIFKKNYNNRVKEIKNMSKLPESVKTMISEIVEQKRIGEVTNDD